MNKAKLVVYPDGQSEVYLGDRLFCAGKLGQSARLEAAIESIFYIDIGRRNVVKLQSKEKK
jgi:hypothetical protein